jgi:hypothetical protein
MSERNKHPLPEELLQAALRDLSADDEARVQAHLAGCPECAVQVEEYRETDREFAAYYQSEFKNAIPPPPGQWQGFRSALHDQVSAEATLAARWKAYAASWLRPPRLTRAALVTCAAVLALLTVVRMSQAPVVSAAEILKRAATAERDSFRKVSHATVYQKLRLRFGRTTMTRVVFRDVERHRQVDQWTASDQAASHAPVAAPPDLSVEFQATRLDWNDPLSPAGIQGWLADRERHSEAREEVREDGGKFTVTSRESNNPVTEAQFVVRASDYHPISALYRFQGRSDEVEFTELDYEVRRLETLDAAVRSELGAGADTPAQVESSGIAPASAGSPAPASLDSLEVNALYALHERQADLGGETEVTRQAGVVKVAGVVVSRERKAELTAALARLPDVQVELYTAQEAANRQAHAIASAPESPSSSAARAPALRDALNARFPDQVARDSFVLDVLDCSQQALAHGFALDRLATRYPAEGVAGLSKEARSELRTMSGDHLRTLRKELDSLFERLTPLAGEVRVASAPEVNAGAAEAEPASLVPDLQKLDRIVAGLVSGSDGAEADAGTLVREYQEVAGRLRQSLLSRR